MVGHLVYCPSHADAQRSKQPGSHIQLQGSPGEAGHENQPDNGQGEDIQEAIKDCNRPSHCMKQAFRARTTEEVPACNLFDMTHCTTCVPLEADELLSCDSSDPTCDYIACSAAYARRRVHLWEPAQSCHCQKSQDRRVDDFIELHQRPPVALNPAFPRQPQQVRKKLMITLAKSHQKLRTLTSEFHSASIQLARL